MSKLFDTLEKIQDQKEKPSQVKQTAPRPPAAPKKGRLVPFLVGLVVIVALIVAGQQLPALKKLFVRPTQVVKERKTLPLPAQATKKASAPIEVAPDTNLAGQEQAEYYNNLAVSLLPQGDAWSALYYFDKASQLAPESPEPLINMAIILAKMDLGFPAGRLFKKAYQLTPENAYLLQAIDLAMAEQVLPPDFHETIKVVGMDKE